MKSFKCRKCGFVFSFAANFEEMDKEEYKELTACPCGGTTVEIPYSIEAIPTVEVESEGKE